MSVWSAMFELTYSVSPIMFSGGGVASNIPGGFLPTMAITDAAAFASLLGGGPGLGSLDDAFAHFVPLPSSTLISQQTATYPLANQAVAGNAVIAQPLQVDMLMICPAREQYGGYQAKLGIITSLQNAFAQQNSTGGTYYIMTPAFTYGPCTMLDMIDVSSTQTKQVQMAYKLSFLQPLISLQDATAAYNNMMGALNNGTPPPTATSGPSNSLAPPSGADGGNYGFSGNSLSATSNSGAIGAQ